MCMVPQADFQSLLRFPPFFFLFPHCLDLYSTRESKVHPAMVLCDRTEGFSERKCVNTNRQVNITEVSQQKSQQRAAQSSLCSRMFSLEMLPCTEQQSSKDCWENLLTVVSSSATISLSSPKLPEGTDTQGWPAPQLRCALAPICDLKPLHFFHHQPLEEMGQSHTFRSSVPLTVSQCLWQVRAVIFTWLLSLILVC